MVKAPCNGKMVQVIRENGNLMQLMVRASFSMLKVTSMMVNGQTTKQMVSVSIPMLKVLVTRVIGRTINNTEKEQKTGQKVQDMKVNIIMAASKELANTLMQMVQAMMVNGTKTK